MPLLWYYSKKIVLLTYFEVLYIIIFITCVTKAMKERSNGKIPFREPVGGENRKVRSVKYTPKPPAEIISRPRRELPPLSRKRI